MSATGWAVFRNNNSAFFNRSVSKYWCGESTVKVLKRRLKCAENTCSAPVAPFWNVYETILFTLFLHSFSVHPPFIFRYIMEDERRNYGVFMDI
jgi:hypothetical protein